MKEYGWTHREQNGKSWLEYGRVRVGDGKRGTLDKVWLECRPSDLTIEPKVGEALANLGAMIAIQQRFTNTPIEEQLLGIKGWLGELADVGRDLERVGEIAWESDFVWNRMRSRKRA